MHAYCTRFLVVIFELLCRRAREVHHATLVSEVARYDNFYFKDKNLSCSTVVIYLTVPEQASPLIN